MDSYLPDHKIRQQTDGSKSSNAHRPPPSTTQVLSSAKVVAGAATSVFHHETEQIDRANFAGAAADLLHAAAHYGKVEETSFGKYIDKAEDYLHQYHTSHSSASPIAKPPTAAASHQRPSANEKYDDEVDPKSSGGGGLGDYLKLAEGFLRKH